MDELMAADEVQPASGKDIEDVAAVLKDYYKQASDWNEWLGRQRIAMQRAYNAEPYGNERENRSQVVMSDVRDTVSAVMPSLMRVFFGNQKAVEFLPTGPETAKIAEQATDYVRYVIQQDNPGFLEFYRWFKDALIGGLGVMKVWWDQRQTVRKVEFDGLDQQTAAVLAQEAPKDAGVTVEMRPDAEREGFVAGSITYRGEQDQVRIQVVPPEEFLIEPGAVTLDRALYVAHRTLVTVSDLVAMGYPRELVEEHISHESALTAFGEERFRRWQAALGGPNADEAARPVLYVEHYVLIDADGDGVAERHRICTLGESMTIVADDVVDEVPFVAITPDPEAHQFVGTSLAERVADLQRIKTSIMRGVLDSLAQSIMPRYAVVEGQASLADVLNQDLGAPIRMSAPGMVQPLAVPFVGREAFPLIQYIDDLKENRTGISKAAVGLDPDSLQSATQAAVAATIRGAQERTELLARVFAETGVAPLYRLVYRLLVRHQRRQRVVRLRGQWVAVNPASWIADLQVTVNVGIGEGTVQERTQALLGLAAKMEQLLQMLGPGNPLVTLAGYREVLAEVLELSGIPDVNRYLPPVDPQVEAMAAQAQQQPDPDKEAALLLAQVQVKQIEAEIAMKQAELRLKEQEMQLRHEREMQQMILENELKLAEIKLKYGQKGGGDVPGTE